MLSLVSMFANAPPLTLRALQDREQRDPLAALLASVVARSECCSSFSVIRPAHKERGKAKADAYFRRPSR